MNGDNDDDVDPKDFLTAPEILESVTLGLIEMLRRKRVCFCPELRLLGGLDAPADFYNCLPYLGDCNGLIVCAPDHDREWVHAKIRHYVYCGDFDHIFDRRECVGTDHGEDWIREDALLFSGKKENLLVARAEPDAMPQATRPPENQFWAHYAVMSIFGRNDKLHLLHLGLSGNGAWAYFLGPHQIQVARIIANP